MFTLPLRPGKMSRHSQKRLSLGLHQQNVLQAKGESSAGNSFSKIPSEEDSNSKDNNKDEVGGGRTNNNSAHEATRMMRRRRLVRFWLAMISLVMVSILFMSYWAVRMSREKAWKGYGACFRAPRDPGDRRRDKDFLSIVNFNAEWLFLRGGTGQIVCPSESCPWANKEEARNHLKQVARVITELDADIYNLNEVENCSVLDDLLELLPEGHGYHFYLVNGEDSATGQNPAILTRLDPVVNLRHSKMRVEYPLPGSKCKYGELGVTGASKHYATRFKVVNSRGFKTEFVMAGFHFLAKPKDLRRCARREAQAAIVRDVVENMRKPGDLVILAGDCNDFDNNVLGADGQKSITEVLKILRGNDLVNAAERVPQSQRYSSWFDYDQNCIDNGRSEHSLIDHVLLSREWEINFAGFHHAYNVSCKSRVSDHWPFKVVLKL